MTDVTPTDARWDNDCAPDISSDENGVIADAVSSNRSASTLPHKRFDAAVPM
jgi:hypothetical protein